MIPMVRKIRTYGQFCTEDSVGHTLPYIIIPSFVLEVL